MIRVSNLRQSKGMENNTLHSLGLLILRVVIGIIFIANGFMMLNKWGIESTIHQFAGAGIPMTALVVYFSIAAELIGGFLFIADFATRLLALAYVAISAGAIYYIHWAHGLYVSDNGYEYILLLGVASLLFVFTGPGKFSVDYLIARATRGCWGKKNKGVSDDPAVAAYSA